MNFLAAFGASLIYVFLKATQQLNVQHAEYLKMPPVSLLMGLCEVFIVSNVVRTASSVGGLILLAVCIGTGSGLGSILGTWFYLKGRA